VPYFRFFVHGRDRSRPEGQRGFYTTRHAFGSTQEIAAAKVLARLTHEFTIGASAENWRSGAPALEIERAWRIGWHQLSSAPNKGSTFYRE
jgi:hypothetical protein